MAELADGGNAVVPRKLVRAGQPAVPADGLLAPRCGRPQAECHVRQIDGLPSSIRPASSSVRELEALLLTV